MQFSPDGYWMWNGVQWVPNPYRPAAPPVAWARPYETADFRAFMAILFLIANAVAVGLSTSWDFVNIAYLQTVNPDQNFKALWALLALLVILLAYGTLIPAYVFFSMWVHRVVRNMAALGSPDWRTSPGLSVGLSFIPVANLAYPYLAVLDAWRASEPGTRWLDRATRSMIRPPAIAVAWWALWILAFVASRTAYFMERSSDVNMKITGSLFDIANAVLIIGAAVFAILVIRALTARQDRKNELIATGQLV